MEESHEDIIGFDALYESMRKCKKGVLWKDSAASFVLRGAERVEALSEELQDGTYKAREPKHFIVTSPKKRDIASISFRDRVYQRSLNDNAVYPQMTKGFIYDNYACQSNKGTDAARERLKKFMHSAFNKYGLDDLHVLQIDIHGYFPNMDHETTLNVFKDKLDDWSYQRVEKILTEQYDGETGYNPGSQLVQIAGISLLDDLDHYIKEQLHIKYYIRYMDDLILIHQDKEYLSECKDKISEQLALIKLEFNPKKTRIYSIKKGILFLGFTFKLTDTGKVLMFINPEKVKAQRKKLFRLVKRSKRSLLPRSSVDKSYEAWRNHAEKGNNYNLIKKMDKYYLSLWEDTDDGVRKQNQNDGSGKGHA